MIVLDASAAVDALGGHAALLDRLDGETLHAPHLLDIEVTSALHRLALGKRIPAAAASSRVDVLARADIRRHPHVPLLPIIWALRDRLAPYDAAYVALAAALDIPLVTTDRRLAAVPDLPCAVEAF